jgi:predicted ATPase
VVGKVFWRGALSELQPQRGDLSGLLGSLEHRGLIRRETVSRIEGEHQFSFKHFLIRDAAYQTLPRPERRQRHAAVARFLERATPDLGDAAAVLAYHWQEAGDTQRAIENLMSAAEQAGRGWAKERSAELYREALALVPDDAPEVRRDIVRRLAVASQAAWHIFDAEQLQERREERS